MIRLIALAMLLSCRLPAEEAADGVAAYWAYRGRDNGEEIEHHDLSAVALRAPAYTGPVSAIFYSFQWEVTEGQPQQRRDLLLLLDNARLVGWYNISGSNNVRNPGAPSRTTLPRMTTIAMARDAADNAARPSRDRPETTRSSAQK